MQGLSLGLMSYWEVYRSSGMLDSYFLKTGIWYQGQFKPVGPTLFDFIFISLQQIHNFWTDMMSELQYLRKIYNQQLAQYIQSFLSIDSPFLQPLITFEIYIILSISNFKVMSGYGRQWSLGSGGGNPFGSGGGNPLGSAGGNPFGSAGGNPFGSVGGNPLGSGGGNPLGSGGGNPLGRDGGNPLGSGGGNPLGSGGGNPLGSADDKPNKPNPYGSSSDPFGNDGNVQTLKKQGPNAENNNMDDSQTKKRKDVEQQKLINEEVLWQQIENDIDRVQDKLKSFQNQYRERIQTMKQIQQDIKQFLMSQEKGKTTTLNKKDLIERKIKTEIEKLKQSIEQKKKRKSYQCQQLEKSLQECKQKKKHYEQIVKRAQEERQSLEGQLKKYFQQEMEDYAEQKLEERRMQIKKDYEQIFLGKEYAEKYEKIQKLKKSNSEDQQKLQELKQQCEELRKKKNRALADRNKIQRGQYVFNIKDYNQEETQELIELGQKRKVLEKEYTDLKKAVKEKKKEQLPNRNSSKLES